MLQLDSLECMVDSVQEQRQTCHSLYKLTMYFLQDLGLDDDIAEDEGQGGAQKASIADLFGDSDEE